MKSTRKHRIGFALGAGGARGWAHIGAIRALEEHGIRPDIISGTSIGALVGAACAAGELERLERWVLGLARSDVLALVDPSWRGGFIRGRKLADFFRAHFTDRDVSALALAYGAVATDLATGREIWLREGDVVDVVRASIAIPGMFAPIERDGMLLVDGSLVNPVPVSMCRALGADIVIAVVLGWDRPGNRYDEPNPPPQSKRLWSNWVERLSGKPQPEHGLRVPSALEVFMASIAIAQTRIARSRLAGEPPDALITPLLPDFRTMDFHRARPAIEEGRAAVRRMLPLIAQVMEQ